MSYEIDSINKISCPCSKGDIIEELSSNDWNQVKSRVYIECDVCRKRYHIESQSEQRGDHASINYYLVPNGDQLQRNNH
jgi:hypothetical protein